LPASKSDRSSYVSATRLGFKTRPYNSAVAEPPARLSQRDRCRPGVLIFQTAPRAQPELVAQHFAGQRFCRTLRVRSGLRAVPGRACGGDRATKRSRIMHAADAGRTLAHWCTEDRRGDRISPFAGLICANPVELSGRGHAEVFFFLCGRRDRRATIEPPASFSPKPRSGSGAEILHQHAAAGISRHASAPWRRWATGAVDRCCALTSRLGFVHWCSTGTATEARRGCAKSHRPWPGRSRIPWAGCSTSRACERPLGPAILVGRAVHERRAGPRRIARGGEASDSPSHKLLSLVPPALLGPARTRRYRRFNAELEQYAAAGRKIVRPRPWIDRAAAPSWQAMLRGNLRGRAGAEVSLRSGETPHRTAARGSTGVQMLTIGLERDAWRGRACAQITSSNNNPARRRVATRLGPWPAILVFDGPGRKDFGGNAPLAVCHKHRWHR